MNERIVVDSNGRKHITTEPLLHSPQSKQEQDKPIECKRCGGSGVIDDGEIDCYEDGTPFENGPIKCVKDCPDCTKPQAKEWVGLTDKDIQYLQDVYDVASDDYARAIDAMLRKRNT
jgi:hypothetical protein